MSNNLHTEPTLKFPKSWNGPEVFLSFLKKKKTEVSETKTLKQKVHSKTNNKMNFIWHE